MDIPLLNVVFNIFLLALPISWREVEDFIHQQKMVILQLVHATNFQLQATFATKILIVALDKSQTTLVANDNKFWMKEKVNKIHLHPLTCHIRIVACNQDATFWVNKGINYVLPRVPTLNNFFKNYYFEIIQDV